MRRLVGLALVVTLSAGAPAWADRPASVTYLPPVDAPLMELFRAPASPFGPGNRGVDYATLPGAPVRAAASGEVTFAGRVGLSLHVVVRHADGIRTSYSFLASAAVRGGERVAAGHVLGLAGGPLHFGARAGDVYLDPLVLFGAGGPPRVELVADEARAAPDQGLERSHLERMLRALGRVGEPIGAAAVGWARSLASPATLTVDQLGAVVPGFGAPVWSLPVRLVAATTAWRASQATCTQSRVPPPGPSGRRVAVLVGGLGSSSTNAAIDDVDTAALGYDAADVVRFSYRGGSVSDHGYGPPDTQVDIRTSGRRLRALLEGIEARNPGVPIDVIAHSQGGLVARSALGERAPPAVHNLVTLGTPHQGADLATALHSLSSAPSVGGVAAAARRLGLTGIDPHSESVRQLAETSPYIRELGAHPLPAGVRVVSIAARGDVVVASPRSRVPGAANVVVPVPAVSQHGELPGSAAARREMALALRGMAPTCETLADALADEVVGHAVGHAEDASALVLASLVP